MKHVLRESKGQSKQILSELSARNLKLLNGVDFLKRHDIKKISGSCFMHLLIILVVLCIVNRVLLFDDSSRSLGEVLPEVFFS